MGESLDIAIRVLADWRVIAATIGTILVWSLLRYVGLVYRRPKLPFAGRAASKAARKPAPAKAPAPAEGEEMID